MEPTPVTREEIDALNQQARVLFHSRSEESRALAEQACRHSVAADYPNGYVHGLLNAAMAITLQGSYQEAVAMMRHSLYLGEIYGLDMHVAECLQEIARAYYTLADYDRALQYWAQCLDVARDRHAQESYVMALIGLGQIYFAHQDFEAALRHHEKAREGLNPTVPDRLHASVPINIGMDLLQLRRLDEALHELEIGLNRALHTKNREYEADAHHAIGLVLLAQGQLDTAERHLCIAIDVCQRFGKLWGEANSRVALGQVELARDHPVGAIRHLQEARDLAEQIGAQHLLLQVELHYARALELLGDHRQSLHYFKRYHERQLEVMRQTSPYRMQAMEMRLEVEKARLENDGLKRERANQRRELRRVEQLASQDSLTGILNRRGLERLGSGVFGRSCEQASVISLMLLDIDHFKQVNDRFGHLVGDKVLRQVAALLKSGCRQDDVVGRFGGEEFVIVLPGHDASSALDVAERLRQMVAGWPWARIAPELAVTLSVGVAGRQCELTLSELIESADKRLYHAKNGGRNRVCG
ncbi:diguanylate cyclase [Chitiniphilus purpureus]|uniref:diguanylate cyclase n=1 Tax=Chitiniphilus purpureus TaxID=2981137 RepID=A0ABY6DM28_9NEIS|nr:diguanylate cyclase [Chitiniphilus sp. CD1]UXY15420.1 diguanylate cyclase [Chitiniphilus sp. CD1]